MTPQLVPVQPRLAMSRPVPMLWTGPPVVGDAVLMLDQIAARAVAKHLAVTHAAAPALRAAAGALRAAAGARRSMMGAGELAMRA
jgi:hypothetical protein